MTRRPVLPEVHDTALERDPRSLRRASQLNLPLPTAQRWVSLLPGEIQPRGLLQRFPRIANKLARLWGDGEAVADYLDHLLVDERGKRQGFPPDVHNELLNLRDYIEGRYPNLSRRGGSKASDRA
jgi:hypothetical protein